MEKQKNERSQKNLKEKTKTEACERDEVDEGYKKTSEKGQGSEDDMARLKRVREESVRDLGMLLMINGNKRIPT